jgi:hypothetical protein
LPQLVELLSGTAVDWEALERALDGGWTESKAQ